MTSVPCNGCRLCCIGERVALTEEEAKTFPYEEIDGYKLLSQKPGTNECIYLTDTGCSVHDHAPTICREFDCRSYFLSMTRKERRLHILAGTRHGYTQKSEVFKKGRQLLDTMTAQQRTDALAERKPEPKGRKRQKMYNFKGAKLLNET